MTKKIINALSQGTTLHGKSYNYKIVKALGQGSFGITYLASVMMQGNLGSTDTTIYVAVKEFFMHEINGRKEQSVTCGSQDGVYDKYKAKFVKEAINLSKLHHDNIIRVIEAFEENDTVYYSMEYIEDGSLDDLIKKTHGLNEAETFVYAQQIGTALQFMHDNKMLHLDLKPSNIMLHNKKAVLIDFGLSKQYDDEGNPESSTTIGGGTPGYAPLEQTNYKGKNIGSLPVTMDVYAFGATLLKMLTGFPPPCASDILNEGFPYDALSAKGVSKEMIHIISKAMEPQRKDRYQSVGEILKALYKLRLPSVTDEFEDLSVVSIPEDFDKPKPIMYDRPIPIPNPTPAPMYGGPIPIPKPTPAPIIHETMYGGPIPRVIEESRQSTVSIKAIIRSIIIIVALIGLIMSMINYWTQEQEISYNLNLTDDEYDSYWLYDSIAITIFAGLGIIQPALFRKFKSLWLGLFIPSILNICGCGNWLWKTETLILETIALIIGTLILVFSSKFSNKLIMLIMALFIIISASILFAY